MENRVKRVIVTLGLGNLIGTSTINTLGQRSLNEKDFAGKSLDKKDYLCVAKLN